MSMPGSMICSHNSGRIIASSVPEFTTLLMLLPELPEGPDVGGGGGAGVIDGDEDDDDGTDNGGFPGVTEAETGGMLIPGLGILDGPALVMPPDIILTPEGSGIDNDCPASFGVSGAGDEGLG